MDNQLYLDSIAEETLLLVEGNRGYLGSIDNFAALKPLVKYGKYDQPRNSSKLAFSKVLDRTELTTLFVCLRNSVVRSLEVFIRDELLSPAREIPVADPSLWDENVLFTLIEPNQVHVPHLKESEAALYCKTDDSTAINMLTEAFNSPAGKLNILFDKMTLNYLYGAHIYWPFKTWVDHQSLRDKETWPWYLKMKAEKAERERREQQAKAKKRLYLTAENQPHMAMFLDPRCPDWLVEIYRKAFLKAVAPRAMDETWDARNELTAIYNRAYEKVKENRGPAWSPDQLPWERKGEKK
jgi:hypothetical protein